MRPVGWPMKCAVPLDATARPRFSRRGLRHCQNQFPALLPDEEKRGNSAKIQSRTRSVNCATATFCRPGGRKAKAAGDVRVMAPTGFSSGRQSLRTTQSALWPGRCAHRCASSIWFRCGTMHPAVKAGEAPAQRPGVSLQLRRDLEARAGFLRTTFAETTAPRVEASEIGPSTAGRGQSL